MRTNFTADQLQDPSVAKSAVALRRCVHCGLCTATCPTYVLRGDELDSPRGRIYLMKEMLQRGGTPDPKTVLHIDRCLSCLACTTTCPSSVDYTHLIDHARGYIETNFRRPWMDRFQRALVAFVVPYPRRFRWAIHGARWLRPLLRWMPRRWRPMLALAPSTLPARSMFREAGQAISGDEGRLDTLSFRLGTKQR